MCTPWITYLAVNYQLLPPCQLQWWCVRLALEVLHESTEFVQLPGMVSLVASFAAGCDKA